MLPRVLGDTQGETGLLRSDGHLGASWSNGGEFGGQQKYDGLERHPPQGLLSPRPRGLPAHQPNGLTTLTLPSLQDTGWGGGHLLESLEEVPVKGPLPPL